MTDIKYKIWNKLHPEYQNAPVYIKCPFCGEDDFDKQGLKSHLESGYCGDYNNTEVFKRLF